MNLPHSSDGLKDTPDGTEFLTPERGKPARRSQVRHLLPRVSRATGSYAGILALALILSLVAGVLSGVFRPVYTARIAEDANIILVSPGSQEFDTWLGMITGSSILGIIVALVAFFRAPELLGPKMLAWVTLCSLLGAFTLVGISDVVAHLVHQPPAPDALEIGQDYELVPRVDLDWGAIISPYLALLSYWSATVLVRPGQPRDHGDG
ncbi:hypothetical protein [Corynebacterium sp. CCM 9203]|uniref:hypothetical protein n=1 Tax=Corynebacterium sp. CCM 9203 TaxID=3057615 RepID=UPI003523C7AB